MHAALCAAKGRHVQRPVARTAGPGNRPRRALACAGARPGAGRWLIERGRNDYRQRASATEAAGHGQGVTVSSPRSPRHFRGRARDAVGFPLASRLDPGCALGAARRGARGAAPSPARRRCADLAGSLSGGPEAFAQFAPDENALVKAQLRQRDAAEGAPGDAPVPLAQPRITASYPRGENTSKTRRVGRRSGGAVGSCPGCRGAAPAWRDRPGVRNDRARTAAPKP